jgi:hypothetical protein
MAEVVLSQISERVVISVDEIDTTLRLNFTDNFFAGIRFLYNARATNPALARLSFVLRGVASPGDLMKDPERTPFNIGERVDLVREQYIGSGTPYRKTCPSLPLGEGAQIAGDKLFK